MINQVCAICEKSNFSVLYKENFDIKKIDAKIFSARRLPDQIHYRIVKCKSCDLIFSTPILENKKIERLYRDSFLSYDDQLENLTQTYGFYLKQLKKLKLPKEPKVHSRLLEIGCGSGFFLEEAQRLGYKEVWGVEPGVKSAQKARPEIRKNIIVNVFIKGLFKKNFFDCVCCFQTFDHVTDPNNLLSECFRVLRPGGLVLFFNHDTDAWSSRILGEKSPIIDIEHIYLFNKATMKQIFQKHGFRILSVEDAFNIHYLSHWIYLLPLPAKIKSQLLRFLKWTRLGRIKIKTYPGNLVLIAMK